MERRGLDRHWVAVELETRPAEKAVPEGWPVATDSDLGSGSGSDSD